jgi:ubiquinone/menaquinone biosynthesis C-methylase UbiE
VDISYSVTEANRKLYNKLSDNYEVIDGRRSEDLCIWLRKRLKKVIEIVNREANLLDIGCGGGFVVRAAGGLFSKIYGVDISENILKTLHSNGGFPICADARQLPFKDKSIDVAVMFSVIHHFYDYRPILNEIYRVLKASGVIYIDHDMDRQFFKNFHFFVNAYRKFSRKERLLRNTNIEVELYKLSEFHSNGIDSEELKDYLISLGFKIVEAYHHWYGLSKPTNFIFGDKRFLKGTAPISGFVAQKVNG